MDSKQSPNGAMSLLEVGADGWVPLGVMAGGELFGNERGELLFFRINGSRDSVFRVSHDGPRVLCLQKDTKRGIEEASVVFEKMGIRNPDTNEPEFIRLAFDPERKWWFIRDDSPLSSA